MDRLSNRRCEGRAGARMHLRENQHDGRPPREDVQHVRRKTGQQRLRVRPRQVPLHAFQHGLLLRIVDLSELRIIFSSALLRHIAAWVMRSPLETGGFFFFSKRFYNWKKNTTILAYSLTHTEYDCNGKERTQRKTNRGTSTDGKEKMTLARIRRMHSRKNDSHLEAEKISLVIRQLSYGKSDTIRHRCTYRSD